MNQSATYTTQGLRFKRWSRKSYAVFQSLGVSVSIGQLAVHVQEKSAVKLSPAKQNCLINITSDDLDEFKESEDLLPVSLLVENQIVIAQKEIAAAGSSVCAIVYDKLNRFRTGSAFFVSYPETLSGVSNN